MSETGMGSTVAMPEPTKGKKWYSYVLNLIVIALAAYGVWSLYDRYLSPSPTITSTDSTTSTNTVAANTATTQTTSNTAAAVGTNSAQSGWLTYTFANKGFSISYPADWTVTTTDNSDLVIPIITLTKPNSTAIENDISVYYYPSVAEETENVGNNLGATTLDEYVAKNPMLRKIGATTLNGAPAYDVILGGEGAYYSVVAVKNQHLYKIMFNSYDSQSELTDTDRQILSSIKLF